MLEKDKQLLLKDICERIPYGVKCTTKANNWRAVYSIHGCIDGRIFLDCPEEFEGDDEWLVQNIVPYLRPMSSMTKEEKAIYSNYKIVVRGLGIVFEYNLDFVTEWLLKHHFDYRHLIEKGLALEAPKGMYN